MSSEEKRKKKKEELKHADITEVSAKIGYVQEQPVQNTSDVTFYTTSFTPNLHPYFHQVATEDAIYNVTIPKEKEDEGLIGFTASDIYNTISEKGKNILAEIKIDDLELEVECNEEAEFIKTFSLFDMRAKIAKGEASSQQIFNDLKTFILNNKDSNPDKVQHVVETLLKNAEEHYDEGRGNWLGKSGFTRKHQGDNAFEIFDKILNTPEGEEINGFVCSTIHEFGMRLLDECGIKATMLAGGTGGTNHTTLLWQRSDGKYVQSNYGESVTLETTNMKDAAREVYKRGLGLINNGYIYFIDNDGSYQEFAMKDEAVWGDELDKRDYNNQSVFDHSVADKSSIHGTATYSNLGSVSAEVKKIKAYSNDNVSKETSYSIGFKKSNNTSLADSATSVGAKLEHKSEKILDNGKRYTDTKVIVDLTKLQTNSTTVNLHYLDAYKSLNIKNEEQLNEIRDFFIQRYKAENPLESEEEYINPRVGKNKYVYETINGVASVISREQKIEELKSQYASIKTEYENKMNEEVEKNVQFHLQNILRLQKPKDKTQQALNEYSTTHLTAFLRKTFGREKTLLKDRGIELTNGYQFSGNIGINDVLTKSNQKTYTENEEEEFVKKNRTEKDAVFTAFGGDIRLAAEDGLKLDVYNSTSMLSTAVSGGITADMSLKSGTLTPAVSPGIKLNGSTVFQTRISDNAAIGAGVSGYSVVTKPSIDYGATAQVQGRYKPSGSDMTLFGSANYGTEQQRIRIGGFNEKTENVRTLDVSVGAQINPKTSVSVNYNGRFDKLNSTRDRSTISVGARVNL